MPQLHEAGAPLRSAFSDELLAAVSSAKLPPLGEGNREDGFVHLLEGGIGDHLSDVSPRRQLECLSGLWLLAGDIHRSHSISQDLGSHEGSLLHGIMHRREGDFGNSKYWFRRVREHRVFEQLVLHDSTYVDPFAFVDQCESSVRSNDAEQIRRCEELQWLEWQFLMSVIIES